MNAAPSFAPPLRDPSRSFQDMILTLHDFWSAEAGCVILQPYDMRMGAGTFHTATTLRALGPEPWNAAFVQPCRRPTDGRYGENPNRLQHYYQYQVILKPSPPDLQELYLRSLVEIGIDPLKHDIRFVEDDWESPTLGAWGLGWEVWCDGMEVTQFTYFQQMGGFDCKPVAGELTYGLERLAMYIQGVDNVYDLAFNSSGVSYGDVFLENERQMSKWNFEVADTDALFDLFAKAEAECGTRSQFGAMGMAVEHREGGNDQRRQPQGRPQPRWALRAQAWQQMDARSAPALPLPSARWWPRCAALMHVAQQGQQPGAQQASQAWPRGPRPQARARPAAPPCCGQESRWGYRRAQAGAGCRTAGGTQSPPPARARLHQSAGGGPGGASPRYSRPAACVRHAWTVFRPVAAHPARCAVG